ncbi:unnamed protein product, partial [Amoebophrya sp. A120]|eukprot:GSA120T00018386001.1
MEEGEPSAVVEFFTNALSGGVKREHMQEVRMMKTMFPRSTLRVFFGHLLSLGPKSRRLLRHLIDDPEAVMKLLDSIVEEKDETGSLTRLLVAKIFLERLHEKERHQHVMTIDSTCTNTSPTPRRRASAARRLRKRCHRRHQIDSEQEDEEDVDSESDDGHVPAPPPGATSAFMERRALGLENSESDLSPFEDFVQTLCVCFEADEEKAKEKRFLRRAVSEAYEHEYVAQKRIQQAHSGVRDSATVLAEYLREIQGALRQ